MNSIGTFAICLLAIGMMGQQQQPDKSIPDAPPHEQDLIIIARLSTPLDASKAKVGDRVTAKVLAQVPSDQTISPYPWGIFQINGKARSLPAAAMVLPRESMILGHVTQVQKRGKSNPESRLGFTFDQIKLKSGKLLPFNGRIEKIDQYYSLYEVDHDVYWSCESYDINRGCGLPSELVRPDFYGLASVTRQTDSQDILLTSAIHNIKLGWNIQIQLRLPGNLTP